MPHSVVPLRVCHRIPIWLAWLLIDGFASIYASDAIVLSGSALREKAAAATPSPVDLVWCAEPGRELHLFYQRPASATGAVPAVIWIHGGGWASGNYKQFSEDMRRETLKRGYAFVSIQYRLAPAVRWPVQLIDCRAAVRWLRSNADSLLIDAERIIATGESAGGHLAALLGTPAVDAVLAAHDTASGSCRVRAVIAAAGIFDCRELNSAGGNSAVDDLLGGPAAERPHRAAQASPLTYVAADAAPMALIHGGGDKLVPPDQAKRMHAALTTATVPTTLTIVDGAGHPLSSHMRRKNVLAPAFDAISEWMR